MRVPASPVASVAAAAGGAPLFADAHVAKAAERLEGAFDGALDTIATHLPLRRSSYAKDIGVDLFAEGDLCGGVQCFQAPGEAGGHLAWLTATTLCKRADSVVDFSVEAWNAPSTDVPHLQASLKLAEDGIDLFVDYLPRSPPPAPSALAPSASPPPPPSPYFTPDAFAWRAELVQRLEDLDGASLHDTPTSPDAVVSSMTIGGPLRLVVRLPLTDEGLAAAETSFAAACERWGDWKQGERRIGDPQMLRTYEYDSLVRAHVHAHRCRQLQAEIGAVLPESIAIWRAWHPSVSGTSSCFTLARFGPLGRICLASSGPTDHLSRWRLRPVFSP